MKKFILYLLRWQLSSPILALCLIGFTSFNIVTATILANLIGGCIFYWVDKWIFSSHRLTIKRKEATMGCGGKKLKRKKK